MSDTVSAFVIVLNEAISDDHARAVRDALMLVSGVAAVRPVITDISTEAVAIMGERVRLQTALLRFMREELR